MGTKTSKFIIYITFGIPALIWIYQLIFSSSALESMSPFSLPIIPFGMSIYLLYGMVYEFRQCKKNGVFKTRDKIGFFVGTLLGLVIFIGSVYSTIAILT